MMTEDRNGHGWSTWIALCWELGFRRTTSSPASITGKQQNQPSGHTENWELKQQPHPQYCPAQFLQPVLLTGVGLSVGLFAEQIINFCPVYSVAGWLM